MANTLTPEQAAVIEAIARPDHPTVLVQAGAGCGKALRSDQPVLTPTGWRPIAQMSVGDPVIGRDGLTYEVTGVYPQGVRPLYELRFSDGVTVIADAHHRWLVQLNRRRDRGQPGEVLTTSQIINRGVTRPGGGARWFLPMPKPVKLPEAALPIDPWLLGLLLGDGTLHGSLTITSADKEAVDRVRSLVEPLGVTATPVGRYGYRLSGSQTKPGHRGFWHPLVDALRTLGVWGMRSQDKFVPELYKFASADQRLETLRGLMDSDGYRINGDSAEFVSTSAALAADVRWLVQSLGGTATLAEKQTSYGHDGVRRAGRLAYRLRIKLPADLVPFSLARKASGWCDGARVIPFRAIRSITPVAAAEAVCISVSAPDRLFLTTGCVPTHNTFTMNQVALAQPDRRFVYTAFNKALVEDAKKTFPRNVRCTTAHGLAFGAEGVRFKARMDASRFIPAREVADILGITGGFQASKVTPIVHPTTLARYAMRMVNRFMSSADDELHTGHLPPLDAYNDDEQAALAQYLLPYASKAWDDLQLTSGGRLRFEHAVYLKLFQLNRGQIKADVILIDEAQDLSPVMCSIFYRQRDIQKVLVGDSAQAINGFTGAVDALERFPADVELTLTQSFRFGQGVAVEANKWLGLLNAKIRLTGLPSKTSTIVASIEHPDAVLTRTNAGAISAVMAQLEQGRRVALVGGGKQIIQLAEAAIDLQAGRGTSHPELMAFTTWDQLVDYAQNDEADAQLQTLVKLIEDNGADKLLEMANRLTDERLADVTVSTAHKAKGREWDLVEIGPDFRAPREDKETGRVVLVKDELMLAYVAVTRGRVRVARNSLDWIDDHMRGGYVQMPPARPAAPAPTAPPTDLAAPAPAIPEAPALGQEIGPDSAAAGSLLTPGRVVLRRTETQHNQQVRAWVPCHPDQSVLAPTGTQAVVRCRADGCGHTFHLTLTDEGARWAVAPAVTILDTTARHGTQP